MARIYLSSTFSDLKEYRDAVYHALRKIHHDVIEMEHYVASDQRPVDRCLADVASCDLYIGLFAWRYGFIPPTDNPQQKSITELEYCKAIDTQKSRLIFILDKAIPWSPALMDMSTGEGNGGAAILTFKKELELNELVSFFKTPDDLASAVSQAVHNWEMQHHMQPSISPSLLMRTKYLEKVYKRYNSVTLPIGPAEGLSLHAIFQPLMLHLDPLAAEDLERKQRRALLGEKPGANSDIVFMDEGGLAERGSSKRKYAQHSIKAENGNDALQKSPDGRIIILGGPGTGKTTTLKHLIGAQAKKALSDDNASIPVFLSLADLARSEKSLQNYLADVIEEFGIEKDYADHLWREIERGHAFVALDSLDEVAPLQRGRMIKLVNEQASNSGNTWIVGSRFTEYKGGQFKQGQFLEWELLAMTSPFRHDLAIRLLPELRKLIPSKEDFFPSAEEFVRALENHSHAAAWGENPLLFSLAAVVYIRTGGLPSSRVSLYGEVMEAVLAMREDDAIERRNLLRALSGLALWIHQTKGRTFTNDDMLTFLEEIQKRPWEEAASIAKRIISSGILDTVAHETYGFRHQTFQEYLAAVELTKQLTSLDASIKEEAWKFIWSKRTYSRWTEVLRLMIGILSRMPGSKGRTIAHQWLKELMDQRATPEGDPGELGLELVLKSLVEVTDDKDFYTSKLASLEKSVISLWIKELFEAVKNERYAKSYRFQKLSREVALLRHYDPNTLLNPIIRALKSLDINMREAAANVLKDISIFAPLHKLIEMSKDKDDDIREAAITALGQLGTRTPIDALLPLLLDPKSLIREAAVTALGQLGTRAPVDALLPLLLNPEPDVRQAAVTVLGQLGDRVPIDSLLPLLLDPQSNVRWAVVTALGQLGDHVLVDSLLPLLLDPDFNVRRATVNALALFNNHISFDSLLPLLHHESWDAREAVVSLLGRLGDRVSLLPLLQDKNANMRRAAATALGQLGDHTLIDSLLPLLLDSEWQVRRAAATALGQLDDHALIDSLLPLLQDQSENVRRAAVTALGQLGDHTLIDSLLPLLQDKNVDAREATATALGQLSNYVPIDSLLPLLFSSNEELRSIILKIFKKRESEIEAEQLLKILEYSNNDVILASIEIVRYQNDRVPINSLLLQLQNENGKVKRAVVTVLTQLDDHKLIGSLLPLLLDSDSDVRKATISALASFDNRIPLDSLLPLLHHEIWYVRQAAVSLLGKLDAHVSIDSLLPLLQDKNANVRQATLNALASFDNRIPLDSLLPLLHHEIWYAREAAVSLLGKLDARASINSLLPLLQDKNANVRQATLNALSQFGDHVPLDSLLPLLLDSEGFVRQAAVTVLGQLGDHAPIDPLLPLLQDQDAYMRQAAATALGQLSDRAPIDSLLPLLLDPKWNVREAAVTALGQLGDHVPLDSLLPLLFDSDSDVRRAAINVLSRRGSYTSLEFLLSLLEDKDDGIREVAITALARQGDHVSLDSLLPLLLDPEWNVREAAVTALAQFGDRVPLDSLLPLLFDSDSDVREATVNTLAQQRDRIPVNILIENLINQDIDVCISVIELLRIIAPETIVEMVPQAIEALEGRLTGDFFTSVAQIYVANTIGGHGLTSPAFLERLIQLLDWPHPEVQLSAVEALGNIRRYIPDSAIQRLYTLRRDLDPKMRKVREAADDALAEILSLEDGIEDDESS